MEVVMYDNVMTLANTKAIMDALEGEPARLIDWSLRYRADDVIAAKQLADEAGCDFEDVLLTVLG